MTRQKKALLASGLIVAVVVGVGLGLLLAPTPLPSVVAPGSGPSVVTLTVQPFTDQRVVPARGQVTAQQEYRSAVAGMVRASQCSPGQEVVSGEPLLTVDNQVVVALHLATPPWRDLAMGIQGDDVKDFQDELARLGYAVNTDGVYSHQTASVAAEFWKAAGVAKQTSLPLSSIVWLPTEKALPTTCVDHIGNARAGGNVVFTSGGSLEKLTLDIPETVQSGERIAMLDKSVQATINVDDTITDPGFLAAYAQSRTYLQWATDNSTALTVTVQLVAAIQVVAIPPSALYQVSGPHACLINQAGDAVPVQIVGSQLGEAFVTASPLPTAAMVPAPKDAPPCK